MSLVRKIAWTVFAIAGCLLLSVPGCSCSPEPVPGSALLADAPPIFFPSDTEKRVGDEVRLTAVRASLAVEPDPGLGAAARNICYYIRENGASQIESLDSNTIAKFMLDLGQVDSAFRSVFFSSPTVGRAIERIEPMIREELIGNEYTHYGVGAIRSWWPPGWVIGVLLVRKTVALDTLRREYRSGDDLYVQGRVLEGAGPVGMWFQGPTLLETFEIPVGSGGRFSKKYPLHQAGDYRVEIMTSGERGPEVGALFDITVAGEGETPARTLERVPVSTTEEARNRLLTLVNEERLRANLLPLGLDDRLNELAQDYAEEMSRTGRVAHFSESTGDVGDRAEAGGIRYWRISENIAVNQSVENVHEDLMGSPSHRANILDPDVDRAGFGVVFGKDNSSLYVVENFARFR